MTLYIHVCKVFFKKRIYTDNNHPKKFIIETIEPHPPKKKQKKNNLTKQIKSPIIACSLVCVTFLHLSICAAIWIIFTSNRL